MAVSCLSAVQASSSPMAPLGVVGVRCTLYTLLITTDIVPLSFVQILRAYGLGQRKLDNPNAYNLRRTLHKMYFHFKPEFWYWKIGIMIRKFFIVVAGGVLLRSVALLSRDALHLQLSLPFAGTASRSHLLLATPCLAIARLVVPQERHLPDGHDPAGGHHLLRAQCEGVHSMRFALYD